MLAIPDAEATGSVTYLLRQCEDGEQAADAAEELFQRYLPDLLRLARKSPIAAVSRVADGSDFVSSACLDLWQNIVNGSLTRCNNRDDLWPLLVSVVTRHAHSHARSEMCQKRGGGRVTSVNPIDADESCDVRSSRSLRQATERRNSHSRIDPPCPVEFDSIVASLSHLESCPMMTERIEQLQPPLSQIAVLRLLNHSNVEIAEHLGISARSVQRKIGVIRLLWQDD